MNIESFGASDIGLVRLNNEDVFALLPNLPFFILADGMGGHQAGEIAAGETVAKLTKWAAATPLHSAEDLIEAIEKAIDETNQWVHTLSMDDKEMAGMGTTLCLAFLVNRTLVYAHVGDSRIYRVRKGRISRLTVDHSLRDELIASGQLEEEAAANFPYKNVITRAIGTQAHVAPEIQTAEVQEGDLYFLCSDGLTDCLSDSEIGRIIQENPSIKAAVEKLIIATKKKGAPDNVTIVMFKTN